MKKILFCLFLISGLSISANEVIKVTTLTGNINPKEKFEFVTPVISNFKVQANSHPHLLGIGGIENIKGHWTFDFVPEPKIDKKVNVKGRIFYRATKFPHNNFIDFNLSLDPNLKTQTSFKERLITPKVSKSVQPKLPLAPKPRKFRSLVPLFDDSQKKENEK